MCGDFWGGILRLGFFLGLKPAHFRPSWGWIEQGGHSELVLWTLGHRKCQGQDILPPVFPYFLRLSLHIPRLSKPSSAGSALPHRPGHSCPQVQGCPPETSWVSQTLLAVPAQALGWLRSPTRSRTCKHGVSSGCSNTSSAAPPRTRLLVSSPNADGAKTPELCPQLLLFRMVPSILGWATPEGKYLPWCSVPPEFPCPGEHPHPQPTGHGSLHSSGIGLPTQLKQPK